MWRDGGGGADGRVERRDDTDGKVRDVIRKIKKRDGCDVRGTRAASQPPTVIKCTASHIQSVYLNRFVGTGKNICGFHTIMTLK